MTQMFESKSDVESKSDRSNILLVKNLDVQSNQVKRTREMSETINDPRVKNSERESISVYINKKKTDKYVDFRRAIFRIHDHDLKILDSSQLINFLHLRLFLLSGWSQNRWDFTTAEYERPCREYW